MTKVVDVVDKTLSFHSHASNAFSKGMLPTGLPGSWPWLVLFSDGLSQLWRVTEPRSDLENFCGHDTGGFRELLGEV